MKVRLVAIGIALVLIPCTVYGQASGGSVDSVSAASKAYYYEKSSLTGDALYDAIVKRTGAIVVSTSNADGSPNAAIVIPGLSSDRGHLLFNLADNQTKVNMRERRIAVLTMYLYSPQAAEKLERNKGFRLVLEYVSDPVAVKKLLEENKANGAVEATIFMRIVKVLPLG